MQAPISTLPDPIRALFATPTPARRAKRANMPPWLTNLYGTGNMARAQMPIPQIGMDLAALLGQNASMAAPNMPLLNMLLRR